MQVNPFLSELLVIGTEKVRQQLCQQPPYSRGFRGQSFKNIHPEIDLSGHVQGHQGLGDRCLENQPRAGWITVDIEFGSGCHVPDTVDASTHDHKLVKQATKKKTSTVALDDSLEAKLKAWQAKQKTSRRVKTVGGTFKPTVTTDTQSGPARLSAATARPIKHPFRPRHVLARSEVDSDPSTTGGTKHKQALYEVTGLLRESHNAADRGAFDEAIRIASRADWLSRQEGLSTQHENPTKLVAGWEISRIDKSSPQTAAARKTLIDARVDDYLRASQQQSKSGNDSEAKRLATVGHMLAKTTDSAKPAAGKTHPLSSAPSPKFHHPLSSPASKPFQPKHPLQSPEPGQ